MAETKKAPPLWFSPSDGYVYVRSVSGGRYKRVASSYGYAWSSDGVDGYADELPTDAVILTAQGG